jgi:uncharacterized membrane-anchored protein YhcB (DUF1043 family)
MSPDSGQAAQAAQAAQEQTSHLADTAQEQARHVAGEASAQARSMLDQARTELEEHSRTQRDRLVETLQGFAGDLDRMSGHASPGLAGDLTRQVARRAHDLGSRLDGRDPRELLDDVRTYARRHPGTFLLGALAAGVVTGRLVRGARDDVSGGTSGAAPSGGTAAGGSSAPVGGPAAGMTPGTTAAGTPGGMGVGTAAGSPAAGVELDEARTPLAPTDPAGETL